MSIRFRIILGMMLLGMLGFFGLTRWMVRELRPHYLKSMEESMVDQATILASMVSTSLDTPVISTELFHDAVIHAAEREFSAQIYDMNKERINTRIYVTDDKGIVLFDSYGNHVGADYSQWLDVSKTLRGEYGARASRDNEEDENSSVLYVASPILYGDSIIGCLSVGKPAKSVNLFIKNARDNVFIAVMLTAMLLFIFALLFTHWVTVPIRTITGYARDIADAPARISLNPDEFGVGEHNEIRTLAIALEEMRESLEGKKYVEQYIQTLTHEIKSPLSAIRGAIELIDDSMPAERRDRFLQNINNESKRITTIVERLLQLSSLEHRKELSDVVDIDLVETIKRSLESISSTIETKNIVSSFSFESNPIVKGESFLLEQVIINLLSNAADFTPAKGSIETTVKTGTDHVTVTITDSGDGIPDYALERIFERFYSLTRPDSGRKSSGLGLPFVKEAVELHGGTVSLSNSEHGGAVATVTLPYSA